MTKAMAYKILGITPGTDFTEIKKKYRQLMHRVHPDAEAFSTRAYDFTAQEINEAYDFLRKNRTDSFSGQVTKNTTSGRKQHGKAVYHQSYRDENTTTGSTAKQMKWNAPLNENAYTKRTIYHYAEDADGGIIGSFPAATGKYLWILEEDFPLFLKSMFECSKHLLDEVDTQIRRENVCPKRLKFQAELSYLLAQQFIDVTSTLKQLLTPEVLPDADIYSIASMLELAADAPVLCSGTTLYPSHIRNHRLFLTTKSGKNAGYVSFRDDRLYYIIIPLFEQKRAQVKIEISAAQDRKRSRPAWKYKNLDFLIKIPHNNAGTFPENINLQIEGLLAEYAKN